MNKLERKILKEIKYKPLASIIERCKEENKGRMEYEMSPIKRDCGKAIELIDMLLENDSQKQL